ncbi:hypothetical protein [Agathobaculum sp. TL06]
MQAGILQKSKLLKTAASRRRKANPHLTAGKGKNANKRKNTLDWLKINHIQRVLFTYAHTAAAVWCCSY